MEGFYIYYNMKLLSLIKTLISEAKTLIDTHDVNGQDVNIYYNDHSNLAQNFSKYGRHPIEEIKNSMVDILDVIVDVCNEMLDLPSKVVGKDHSILVKDYMIGVDYHFWVNRNSRGKLFLIINTSIRQSGGKLPYDKNDKKIIITKNGDTIIKENFNINQFTKIIKGDIIIYYN